MICFGTAMYEENQLTDNRSEQFAAVFTLQKKFRNKPSADSGIGYLINGNNYTTTLIILFFT